MGRRISEGRKAAFYLGMGLMVVGLILFLSTFISGISNFGNFDNFNERTRSGAFRAFGGMILIVIGGIVRGIGARGAAGAGVILDPEQAREDLEPFSRMAGGMVKDVLEEADVDLGSRSRGPEGEAGTIKVRCRKCRALNDESARFCDQCGDPL